MTPLRAMRGLLGLGLDRLDRDTHQFVEWELAHHVHRVVAAMWRLRERDTRHALANLNYPTFGCDGHALAPLTRSASDSGIRHTLRLPAPVNTLRPLML